MWNGIWRMEYVEWNMRNGVWEMKPEGWDMGMEYGNGI